MKPKIYIREFIRYAFIVLFFYAAVTKLLEHPKFYNDLLNSPVFGNKRIAGFMSWFIPILELSIAGFLISMAYRWLGMYMAFGSILLFTVYISGILLFSENIPCSCGGIISNFTWQEHLIFNICFLLLGLLGIFLQQKRDTSKYT
ncbi:hypothetical protein RM553_04985 [Zunongwangia sp. F363]|uniref:Methylamine utilisation protein MauE domain-containing protein n=1 Tax=Autumnicola tepida TaxID=3075595 RepID=A0ABU3C784_9FLAO|nr:MauE/DoxX family redox-associated membrane protein [Zunongwangia sp. F363]MDT0642182.1 hypothetical protein [Zunongwangia sp. F363]